ncbi:MAG: hydroxymethylbilane synthase [Acidobacteria bacterium]|nr:hydroxymethylbilane synthase [Acidobacteriota bacterium]
MAHPRELRLGTRGSQLALWQAHAVAERIAAAGGPPCRIVIIKTSGDRLPEAPLSDAGGKRLFVKEIEDALLAGDIDLAVHSSKDMPVVLPDGLAVAAVLPREQPLDVIVLPATGHPPALSTIGDLVTHLGQSPSIGTSSVRRIAQLSRLFSCAHFKAIRGNLDTRLRKLDTGGYDAIVLAAAGLRRLGFASRISYTLPATACVPAPGQGIVAIEIRANDEDTRGSIAGIDDAAANAELTAERAVVAALGGGCQTPIGALATVQDDETIEIAAIVVALDGSRAVRKQAVGPRREAAALGSAVGAQLLAEGAGDILAEASRHQSPAVTHPS